MSQTNFILMVMYDLPIITKTEQKAYRQLANYLQKNGFYPLQQSIYLKPLAEKKATRRYIEEIKQIALAGSHIRALTLTYQHFLAMEQLIGEPTWGERLITHPEGVISL